MKAIIEKASDYKFKEERNINTLEDLISISNENNAQIIVSEGNGVLEIVIYDDYIE